MFPVLKIERIDSTSSSPSAFVKMLRRYAMPLAEGWNRFAS